MKFICNDCKKTSHYAAKKIVSEKMDFSKPDILELTQVETMVCPYCLSLDFTEYIEEQKTEQVSNVYVADLTSGANPAIDNLLAQGYKITARYAKQFILEKPLTVGSNPTAEKPAEPKETQA